MARMRSRNRLFLATVTIVAAGAAIWCWRSIYSDVKARSDDARLTVAPLAAPVRPAATPQTRPAGSAQSSTPSLAAASVSPVAATRPSAASSEPATSSTAALAEASAALAAGNLVQARRLLTQAVDPLSDSAVNEQMIQQLSKLADEMLFSPRIVQSDPLVIKHIVESGENLQRIANDYKTTVPLICRVNHLPDPNIIRQGQPLKIVLGPFHATVVKHSFRMYVYCGDTLVKVFPVGLGAEESTPTGRWKIRNKLTHPPFYPPRGGKFIPADDPANPLGGYWIGLEGVDGNAVGQDSYGIHGTNEPDTIGKNCSLGCIRMRNEDVSLLYELLVVHDSIVAVMD